VIETPPADGCYHCGERLPHEPVRACLEAGEQAFCCRGCAAAAQWIVDAGLIDYYRLRAQLGTRVAEAPADFLSWDRPDVLAEHSRVLGTAREITVIVDGMRCAACAWLIDRVLHQLRGIEEVAVNAMTGRVRLRWQPEHLRLSQALTRLANLGYLAHLTPGEALEQSRLRERHSLMLRLGVAALGSVQSMMFAEALYLDFDQQMPAATRDFMRWIALLLATPVVFYAGWPFLRGMLREIRQRVLGMETLIASSVLLAYVGSFIETVRGGPHVWVDAAVMFVFLLLVARAIEGFARQRANATVDLLARARPALAWQIDDADQARQVPVAALAAGDRIRVDTGDAVAADGELLGSAEFDESLLSGESRPITRRAGEIALAGSRCRVGPVEIRVTRTGQDTRLSQLVRLVEKAQEQRPRSAQLADAFASKFVLALLVIAAGVFAVWWQLEPARAFEVALAVLVVSCPCALSLAVPSAIIAANGALAKIGVLAVGNDALQNLANVDVLLLDKTGTLTEGRPRVTASNLFTDQCVAATIDQAFAIAAALEQGSGHPLAAAFSEHAAGGETVRAEQLRTVIGCGVEGVIDGRRLRLGRADFACSGHDDGALWLGEASGTAIARFAISDRPRIDAAHSLTELRRLDVALELLSGDGEEAVATTAAALGIREWRSRQSPEQKLARLRALQAAGRRVAMLGDGINDAPVLAGADLAIAMGSGTALAQQSADLILLGQHLRSVPAAILIARRSAAVIRHNLVWASAYNLLAVPLAATGWVTPWMAAIGMAASSLLVTCNALRLAPGLRRTPHQAQPAQALAAA